MEILQPGPLSVSTHNRMPALLHPFHSALNHQPSCSQGKHGQWEQDRREQAQSAVDSALGRWREAVSIENTPRDSPVGEEPGSR